MISQQAGIAALGLDGAWERAMVEGLRLRRDRLLPRLRALDGVDCQKPEGAIYLFPKVGDWLKRHGGTDQDLVRRLRDEAGVKVLPGTPFGAPGHLRLSMAASLESLDRALDRMEGFFGRK
jgi:aspartate/methionine/tyrosine aminotransferase